jgi:hypothetical protein
MKVTTTNIHSHLKRFWSLLSLVLLFATLRAQPVHNAFLEIGGCGGLGSLNYERALLQQAHWQMTFRSGFSLAPVDPNNGTGLVFPLMINGITGSQRHHLELGAGPAFTVTTKGSFWIRGTASMGYRNQLYGKKLFFRVAYTPIFSFLFKFQWQHWAGISIGINLR